MVKISKAHNIMKKILLAVVAVLLSIGYAAAATSSVTFDCNNSTTIFGSKAPTTGSFKVAVGANWTVEPVTITNNYGSDRVYKSGSTTTPGVELRLYNGGSITITTTSGNIRSIALTGALLPEASMSFDNGLYTSGAKDGNFNTGTWEGDANSVTLKVTAGVSISKFVVTYGDPSTVKPVAISPEGGIFYRDINTPVTVGLTCSTTGAQIKYQLTTNRVSGEIADYTTLQLPAPTGAVTDTTKVVAWATLSGENSAKSGATFKIIPTTHVNTIADFMNLGTYSVGIFDAPLTTLYQYKSASYTNMLFVTDGTNFAHFEGTIDATLAPGQKIQAKAAGTKLVFGTSAAYILPINSTIVASEETTAIAATPKTAAELTANAASLSNQLVVIKNATIAASGSNFSVTDATGTYDAGYNNFDVTIPTSTKKYNIEGVMFDEGGTMKFYLTAIKDVRAATTTFDCNTSATIFGNTPPASGSNFKIPAKAKWTVEPVTITNNYAYNRVYNASPNIQLRLYKKGSITFSTPDTVNIKSIKFYGVQLPDSLMTFSSGVYTPGPKSGDYFTGTWEGDVDSLVLAAAGNVSIVKMIVNTGTPSDVKPVVISPDGGVFYQNINLPQTITLTCPTAGATIYYEITDEKGNVLLPAKVYDNVELDNNVTESRSVFMIAWATLAGETSGKTAAKFTAIKTTGVDNIAAFQALDAKSVGIFNNQLTAVYQYIESGYTNMLFFTDGKDFWHSEGTLGTTYNNGQVIPAGAAGTLSIYKAASGINAYTLTPIVSTFKPSTTENPTAIAPSELTLKALNDAGVSLNDHYVSIKSATLAMSNSFLGTIADGTGSAPLENNFNITMPTDLSKTYVAEGFWFNELGTMTFFPTRITESSGIATIASAAATTIVAGQGTITVNAAVAGMARVFTTGGQLVAEKAIATGANNINVPAGFYIVKVNNNVSKVVVK